MYIEILFWKRLESAKMVPLKFVFGGGMNFKKCALTYVWNYRIWLKCRAMLSFVSTDRYDCKEAYTYTCCIIKLIRKVFHAGQRWTWCSLKSFFESTKMVSVRLPLEGVWNLKNVHRLTFGIIKRHWSVVRCYCLFLLIDIIVRNLANIHFVLSKLLENFSMQDNAEP